MDSSQFAILLRRVSATTLDRQQKLTHLHRLEAEARKAVLEMQGELAQEMLEEMTGLQMKFVSTLLITGEDSAEALEAQVEHARVEALVREARETHTALLPALVRMYDLYFDCNVSGRYEGLFNAVLVRCMRARVTSLQGERKRMEDKIKQIGVTAMVKFEASCKEIGEALSQLDIRRARLQLRSLEKEASNLTAVMPPAVARLRTHETLHAAGAHLFELPVVSKRMRDGYFELMYKDILETYYTFWDREKREKMPLLLVLREAAERALDCQLQLVAATKIRLSSIAAIHKTELPVSFDAAAFPPEKDAEFHTKLVTITSERVADTIHFNCCRLGEGLWMVQVPISFPAPPSFLPAPAGCACLRSSLLLLAALFSRESAFECISLELCLCVYACGCPQSWPARARACSSLTLSLSCAALTLSLSCAESLFDAHAGQARGLSTKP